MSVGDGSALDPNSASENVGFVEMADHFAL
jgi:hypothetical protein